MTSQASGADGVPHRASASRMSAVSHSAAAARPRHTTVTKTIDDRWSLNATRNQAIGPALDRPPTDNDDCGEPQSKDPKGDGHRRMADDELGVALTGDRQPRVVTEQAPGVEILFRGVPASTLVRVVRIHSSLVHLGVGDEGAVGGLHPVTDAKGRYVEVHRIRG